MAASAIKIVPERMSSNSISNSDAVQAAASVRAVSKRFGKTSVLEDISFDVAEGEALVLLGASGSGKTTILRIIAGLEQPYTGKIMLHGKDVTELPARERGVGVIFQAYALFPKMTVEKNIGYGLKIRKRSRKEIRAKVNEPAIFITHDQEEALELGDRIAVVNVGHIEQIGTPSEVYNNPATEYVATFLGAANIFEGIIRGDSVEVGSVQIPARINRQKFTEGQPVKLIFRPEDVSLSKTQELPGGNNCIFSGLVEETSFVGAYERLRIRVDPTGGGACDTGDTPFYLTTETPENQTSKPIIATRPKPETMTVKLRIGDRVFLGLTSFTILPKDAPRVSSGPQ